MGFIKRTTDYLRMIKFSHTLFALPFAGIAFLQALPGSGLLENGPLAFAILTGQILICMTALRSAAMGFNRLADRDIDAQNPRTAVREIPSGKITAHSAGLFILFFCTLFIATAFSINRLCGLLSPIAILLTLGYSYTKRFTWLCHFILGFSIGMAPTATWLAVRGEIALLPLLWTFALTFYISGFDILYACQDTGFDRKNGLYSLPARLGVGPALWIARFSHLIALGLFLAAGFHSNSGIVYLVSAGIVAILFVTEHTLVRPGHLSSIPVAFFHINASISSVLFVGLLLDRFWT